MEHTIEIPLALFMDMYNSVRDDEIKNRIYILLREKGSELPRAHHLRGLFFDAEGCMRFNEELYLESVYHGKVGTYSKTVRENFLKLMESAEMLQSMRKHKTEAEAAVAVNNIPTRAISISSELTQEEQAAVESIRQMLKADVFKLKE